MSKYYLEFSVYSTLRFWRITGSYEEHPLLFDQGWVDDSNLKTKHFYLRGSEHLLLIIKTWAYNNKCLLVRSGKHLDCYRLYASDSTSFFKIIGTVVKTLKEVPFVVFTKSFFGHQYFRPTLYLDFVENEGVVKEVISVDGELVVPTQKMFRLIAQTGTTALAQFLLAPKMYRLFYYFLFLAQCKKFH